MLDFSDPVIAAVRSDAEFRAAVCTSVGAVFMLKADLITLPELIREKRGKKIYVHIDMADGIGKDRRGIEFVAKCGADGIISTKNLMISIAKDAGLGTVQRFFIIDSKSVLSALESIRQSKPDYAEIMPGVIPKAIRSFVGKAGIPIIAGGLVETEQDVITALGAGAEGVSTGCRALWNS